MTKNTVTNNGLLNKYQVIEFMVSLSVYKAKGRMKGLQRFSEAYTFITLQESSPL